VIIFFVLSGFLITSILLTEHRKTGGIDLRNFYRRRAYRIFPTFYCCWLLTMGFDYLTRRFDGRAAVISFFYMMDYGRSSGSLCRHCYCRRGHSGGIGVNELTSATAMKLFGTPLGWRHNGVWPTGSW
jgi:hypothetical protein